MLSSLVTLSQNDRSLAFWLLSTCFLLWVMIMLGGATRLTHAGLSIVEWKPIAGIIPPLTKAEWLEAFKTYQQFPEYKLVNQGMDLPSFQFIYLMEYAHRLFGRLLGLWFATPLIIFWTRGRLSPKLKRRSLIALGLGFLQGIMGWYMVKSGLVKDPSVSHYRLTAHLALALVLYSLLFWTALEVVRPSPRTFIPQHPPLIKYLSMLCCGMVSVTLFYGGLVAGLKAGLIYNTFPLMGGKFIPDEWAFYTPFWVNFFENEAFVQWIHRWLAISTFGVIGFTTGKIWRSSLDKHIQKAAFLFAGVALGQTLLGILTLLFHVPVTLGTLHQGMAVVALSLGLYMCYLARMQKEGINLTLAET